jgi:Neutral/alkaline non-lysosomal ceramidase, C-terminal
MPNIFVFQPAVVFDAPPLGKKFGAVLSDVQTSAPYSAGEIVSAQFVGANPRVSESSDWGRFSTLIVIFHVFRIIFV